MNEGGPLTQEVEYLPFKQRVVGSSPARPTIVNNQISSTSNQISQNSKIEFSNFDNLNIRSLGIILDLEFGDWNFRKGSPSSSRPRTPAFHVGNRGSNPLGDASQ